VIGRGVSARVAGPFTTVPSVIANRLPWQGHLIVPSETAVSRHPSCVQIAV
jgi:hypothetical protein